MKSTTNRRVFNKVFLVVITLLMLIIQTSTAQALSLKPGSDPTGKSQRSIIEKTPWLDPTACPIGPAGPTGPMGPGGPTDIPVAGGNLYMIGDSITVGAQTALDPALRAKDFNPTIDAVSGRTLTQGLGVLASATSTITASKVVVIALGTNSSGLDVDNIRRAINIIKTANPTAQIYWVNVGALASSRVDADALSQRIQANASLGYTVIDWNALVKLHSDYIHNNDGLGVHLSPTGIPAYANMVADAISASTTPPVSSDGCEPPPPCPGGDLIGDTNRDKVWWFLIDKGLTPVQVAGIMGNMQSEAHFEPRLVEYGYLNSRGEISVQDQPSSLDDNVPNTDPRSRRGQPGYGIVQWTGGRRDNLKTHVATLGGVLGSNLAMQLNYFWGEFIGPSYKERAYDPIVASSDIRYITSRFLNYYEVGPPDSLDGRIVNANAILSAYEGAIRPVAPPGGGCGGIATDVKTAALSLLASVAKGDITANNGVIHDLTKMSEGNPIWPCPNDPRTPAPFSLNLDLLNLLIHIVEKYKLTIWSIATGHGCDRFYHPLGEATDLGGATLKNTNESFTFGQSSTYGLQKDFVLYIANPTYIDPRLGGFGQGFCPGRIDIRGIIVGERGYHYWEDGCTHQHIQMTGFDERAR